MKVLVVDDDAFNREGLRLYLSDHGAEVVEAGNAAAAWDLIVSASPQVIVLDISIPLAPESPSHASPNYGLTLANRIKRHYPEIGIVLFSAYDDRGDEVLEMVREGVRGIAYKLKGCPPAALLAAIHDVMTGRVLIDPGVHSNQHRLADELLTGLAPVERQWVENTAKEFDRLTPREKEIAHRLGASHNTEGIAQALSLSLKTTENYIGHVYDKLGLNEMGSEAPHLRRVVVLAKACMIYDLMRAGK